MGKGQSTNKLRTRCKGPEYQGTTKGFTMLPQRMAALRPTELSQRSLSSTISICSLSSSPYTHQKNAVPLAWKVFSPFHTHIPPSFNAQFRTQILTIPTFTLH